jgi:MFS family permease
MLATNEGTSIQMKGTITLNLLITYYFAGVLADRLGRGKSKMVGWIIFFVIIGFLSFVLRMANDAV